MGPQNGIMGDDASFGTDIPETQIPVDDLSRERNMAKFSKSAEYKILKELMGSRMQHWRQFVPGGPAGDIAINQLPNEERGWRWLAADAIILEFQSILNAYEMANEAVKNATTERKRT